MNSTVAESALVLYTARPTAKPRDPRVCFCLVEFAFLLHHAVNRSSCLDVVWFFLSENLEAGLGYVKRFRVTCPSVQKFLYSDSDDL